MSIPTTSHTVEFPYTRSVGPIIGGFLDGLQHGKILGSRAAGRTLVPALEWDPNTGAPAEPDLVEVGPEGEITSWTWVQEPHPTHPLDTPFAFALIRMDGADTSMVHVVDAPYDDVRTGARVRPRWRAEREGHIRDIEAFEIVGGGV
jgi:uncharacterized OB-fold protein